MGNTYPLHSLTTSYCLWRQDKQLLSGSSQGKGRHCSFLPWQYCFRRKQPRLPLCTIEHTLEVSKERRSTWRTWGEDGVTGVKRSQYWQSPERHCQHGVQSLCDFRLQQASLWEELKCTFSHSEEARVSQDRRIMLWPIHPQSEDDEVRLYEDSAKVGRLAERSRCAGRSMNLLGWMGEKANGTTVPVSIHPARLSSPG